MKAAPGTPIHLRVQAYRDCAAEGLTRREVMTRLDVSAAAIAKVASKHGLVFAPANRDRRSVYADFAAHGLTQGQVAERLGVSRAAVSMAAHRYGVLFPERRSHVTHLRTPE